MARRVSKIVARNLTKAAATLSEAELCRRFIEYVVAQGGWAAYPETAGFDILLSRRSDGLLIGIEAKLTLSAKSLAQILPARSVQLGRSGGVDHRAVLVPLGRASQELRDVSAALGVTVIQLNTLTEGSRPASILIPDLPSRDKESRSTDATQHWHDWAPNSRVELPDYVPDSRAGSPAPIRLTPWKIKAIKMSVLLEERSVTPSDFRALGLSMSSWLRPEAPWLVRLERGLFARGPGMPNLRTQHPRNYEEIRADRATWIRAMDEARRTAASSRAGAKW